MLGEWVLATYHCYHILHVHFVLRRNGKPAVHWNSTPYLHDAYRWNSYHAAAKFKRENKLAQGYVILNLKEIKEQCEQHKKLEEAETQQEREEARRRFGDDD